MLPNVVTFYAGHQSNLAILTDRMVGGGGGAQLGKLKLAAICKLMLEQLKIVSVSQKSVNTLVYPDTEKSSRKYHVFCPNWIGSCTFCNWWPESQVVRSKSVFNKKLEFIFSLSSRHFICIWS